MKVLILLIALSSLSFSQTTSGELEYKAPSFVVTSSEMENLTNCWARIFQREDFEGASAMIVGYTSWSDMKNGTSPLWSGAINSVETGPNARLILYGSPYFSDEDHVIESGVSVRNLPQTPPGNSIQSLKLFCEVN